VLSTLLAFAILAACITPGGEPGDELALPFIKNSANECYYLDEFMPTPDSMVTGRTGSLSLRYYTYKLATFKDWQRKKIILSFYSQDERCWSLFEEYYLDH
jgi:hypothetical protein